MSKKRKPEDPINCRMIPTSPGKLAPQVTTENPVIAYHAVDRLHSPVWPGDKGMIQAFETAGVIHTKVMQYGVSEDGPTFPNYEKWNFMKWWVSMVGWCNHGIKDEDPEIIVLTVGSCHFLSMEEVIDVYGPYLENVNNGEEEYATGFKRMKMSDFEKLGEYQS